MNAKNIILAILMILSFTACSSEIEDIDNNMVSNTVNSATAVTSLVISFSADELTTKNTSSAEEAEVSEAEMNINEYVIAVFEKQTGDRVGFATGTNGGNNVSTQTIQNIDCKEGDVIVYVVANAPSAKFSNLYKRKDFEAATVVNPNALVKVGKQEFTLEQGKDNSLEVKLSQLTARVKVTVNVSVAVESKETVSFNAESYDAMIANSSAIQDIIPINGENTNVNISNNSFTYYTYAVTNPELTLNGKLIVADNNKTNDVTINIPFKKDGEELSSLKNGVSYEITVDATLTVDINYTPKISYQVHSIETIDPSITFE